MSSIQEVYDGLCLTCVFNGVLDKPVFKRFLEYCETPKSSPAEKRKAYARFVAAIYAEGDGSLTELVHKEVFENENAYVKTAGKGVRPDGNMERSARRELSVFSAFAALHQH